MADKHKAHDYVFKSSMKDVRIAKDFFENYLPIEIKQAINLNILKTEDTTYVDPILEELRSDILYSVEISGNLGYIHLLCEHQSTVDDQMPIRDLGYKLGIWRDHIKLNQTNQLPLIISIVFYNGTCKYEGPLHIKDMMLGPKNLIEKLYDRPIHLINVNDISDKELRDQVWFGILGYFMKHVRDRDFPVKA